MTAIDVVYESHVNHEAYEPRAILDCIGPVNPAISYDSSVSWELQIRNDLLELRIVQKSFFGSYHLFAIGGNMLSCGNSLLVCHMTQRAVLTRQSNDVIFGNI